jgi:hypothetical protein
LKISRVGIPCALKYDTGGAVRSTQRQLVLYITVTVLASATTPNPSENPQNIPTEGDRSPPKETTTPGSAQFTAAEPPSSLPRHPPIENDTPVPQTREEISSTEDPVLARRRADEAMKAISQSKTWESAVERVNWVMEALGPVAEVRSTIPFFVTLD